MQTSLANTDQNDDLQKPFVMDDSIDVAFDGVSSVRLRSKVLDLDPLVTSGAESVSITLRFSPLDPNGLLLWMGDSTDYFLAMARECLLSLDGVSANSLLLH